MKKVRNYNGNRIRRVRKGVVYRWACWSPYNPTLKEGDLVRVVNIPGGSRGGVYRNVMDEKGRVHFVHTGNLKPRNA
jgi:hypothetical protein